MPKTHRTDFKSERERILSDRSDFGTVETLKTIRTNLMFSLPKQEGARVFALSSAAPGEGKTTVSINLSITFAETGTRVLLIDADMRKPRTHRYLGVERGVGLSNVLCGYSAFEDAVVRGVRPNLDLLTAGELPPNPSELIESAAFCDLLSSLRDKYDTILIDTPPVTVVTDTALILRAVDGVALVIRQDSTRTDALDETVSVISASKTPLLGFVFLSAAGKRVGRYGHYRKKYGYGYKYQYAYAYADKDDEGGSDG